MSGSEIL
ncbi:hypothetical protein V3C99_001426 [Haemonchus contortus]